MISGSQGALVGINSDLNWAEEKRGKKNKPTSNPIKYFLFLNK